MNISVQKATQNVALNLCEKYNIALNKRSIVDSLVNSS